MLDTMDTLEAFDTLKEADFSERQARAISIVTRKMQTTEHLATKEDLLKFSTKEDLLKVEKDLRKDLERFATKEDLERFATKEDLLKLEKDLRKDLEKFATKEDLLKLDDKLETKFATKDDLKKLGLHLIIYMGGLVFAIVNAGPFIPKLFHLILGA